MENEIWKPVLNYENHYEISNFGNIRSLKKGKLRNLVQCPSSNHYMCCFLCINGKRTTYLTHILVAQSFLNYTNKDRRIVIDHIDRDRKNNKLNNLRIVTQRENTNRRHKKCYSKFTGVSFNKSRNKWTASIFHNKKSVRLGSFDTELEAYKKRKKYEIENNILTLPESEKEKAIEIYNKMVKC